MSLSGYCPCACRDCFEIAITSDGKPALCNECEASGCDCNGNASCEVPPDFSDEENDEESEEDEE